MTFCNLILTFHCIFITGTVNCSSITTVNQSDYFACECKRIDGNPSADVTWYKDNTQIGVTGKEEAILILSNVDKDDNGTYRCETKSQKGKNKTIELIVNCTYNRILMHRNLARFLFKH